jgi:hypothetical protein
MALTIDQFVMDERIHLGDDTAIEFSDMQIIFGLVRAMRSLWPWFFEAYADETSFTGTTNKVAENTSELAVPAGFLASGSGYSSRGVGDIWHMQARMWDGTVVTPVPARWFTLESVVQLDPLTQTSPKIRFVNEIYNRTFEVRLFGGRPFTPPQIYRFSGVASTDVLTCSPTGVFTNGSTVVVDQIGTAALPTPLVDSNIYYIINQAASTFKVALTSGGAAVDLTVDGNGTACVTSDTLAGSDIPGLVEYLMWRTEEFVRGSRQVSSESDREANNNRRLLAMQKAGDVAKTYKMPRSHETLFNNFGM